MKNRKLVYIVLIISALSILIGLLLTSPIPQDPAYHNFSDTKNVLSIPNFWNVVSNLPFLFIGLFAMYRLKLWTNGRIQYFMFFLGIVLASVGSAYYHWNPTDETLIWDRLPMTISFMSIFSIVISEFVDIKLGQKILIPALFAGLFSIMYWVYFSDLRIYAIVQFYPLILLPLVLFFCKSKFYKVQAYWLLLVAYVLAKVFEHFDYQVHGFVKIMSGHSLKHLTAALGILILMLAYTKREKLVLEH